MSWREKAKRRAALEAVKLVQDGYIVGLGTGSTVAYAIKEIGRRIREENLRVLGVPTSNRSLFLAVECGIPLTTLYEHPTVDIDIDGADQIDLKLNLIKGGGGALTREKIVAASSRKVVIVADETKLTDNLGERCPIPLEVLPFATPLVCSRIKSLGGKPVLRENKDSAGPFVTDNGNLIIDADFGIISNPRELEAKLKAIPGVVETGLFLGIADVAYIGSETSVRLLRRKE